MNWQDFIDQESKKEYFIKLKSFIDKEYETKTIFPKKENIFNAFKLTKFDDVKVVVLGQDPYHEINQAIGLAFAVPTGTKIPPSLLNIYKEIENEFNIVKLYDGDLSYWAKQGVLLLNTILTVEEHKPLSHQNKGWEIFSTEVVKTLNDDEKPKVFLLWGSPSIAFEKYITNPKHLVLKSVHPSPLSAYRGFFGNNHFKLTNEFLLKNNMKEINW